MRKARLRAIIGRRSNPPTLVNSIAALLDVYGVTQPPAVDPSEAVYEDWALVGDDLRAAAEAVAGELAEEHQIEADDEDKLLVEA